MEAEQTSAVIVLLIHRRLNCQSAAVNAAQTFALLVLIDPNVSEVAESMSFQHKEARLESSIQPTSLPKRSRLRQCRSPLQVLAFEHEVSASALRCFIQSEGYVAIVVHMYDSTTASIVELRISVKPRHDNTVAGDELARSVFIQSAFRAQHRQFQSRFLNGFAVAVVRSATTLT
jgi:hypothetical protein